MANSIRIDGLKAGYAAVRVLDGVSLAVEAGETVALLGTNGNGKSTLIKCIMGILRPTAGRVVIEVDGVAHDPAEMAVEDVVDLGVALVPEGRRLFPKLSVEENLLLGAYRGTARAALRRNLDDCYQAFPRLKERRRQLAGSMSGGEQQLLALARALMSEPRFLVIDEPSVGLAPIMVSLVMEKIRELKERRRLTVLMAEQNFHQASKICDRGYIIVHGEIACACGSAEELNNNELVRKYYLGL